MFYKYSTNLQERSIELGFIQIVRECDYITRIKLLPLIENNESVTAMTVTQRIFTLIFLFPFIHLNGESVGRGEKRHFFYKIYYLP